MNKADIERKMRIADIRWQMWANTSNENELDIWDVAHILHELDRATKSYQYNRNRYPKYIK